MFLKSHPVFTNPADDKQLQQSLQTLGYIMTGFSFIIFMYCWLRCCHPTREEEALEAEGMYIRVKKILEKLSRT